MKTTFTCPSHSIESGSVVRIEDKDYVVTGVTAQGYRVIRRRWYHRLWHWLNKP